MSTTITLNGLGHICVLAQRTCGPVRAAIKALGMEPAAIINGVEHYSDEQVNRILAALQEKAK
jgi:hypothetical protein